MPERKSESYFKKITSNIKRVICARKNYEKKVG